MVNDTTNPPLKRCTKCKRELPATTKHFHRNSSHKTGLASRCKECRGYVFRDVPELPAPQPGFRRCSVCGEEKPSTSEYFHRDRTGLTARCKLCACQKSQQWYADNTEQARSNHRRYQMENAEAIRIAKRKYYDEHIEERREYNREYRIVNADARREYNRNWRAKNPDKVQKLKQRHYQKYPEIYRRYNQQRYARKRNLPTTFTAEQWNRCLNYFNHTCAYCGAQQSFWFVLEQDHVIAVANGGGYVASNIIPACRGCNAKKHDAELTVWLVGVHGKRKASGILARINAYFEWIKEQDQ